MSKRFHYSLFRPNFTIYFSISISLFLISCSTDPLVLNPEALGDYYIRSKISPNLDRQGVIVGKTIPENMPIDITNAIITISSENQSVCFDEIEAGIYVDTQKQLKVLPGNFYTIDAKFPDGHLMNGRTTVPDEFQFITSSIKDTLVYILLDKGNYFSNEIIAPEIAWSKSEHALSYELLIVEKEGIKGRITTIDTSVVLPSLYPIQNLQLDTTISWIDLAVIIEVVAHDSSFLAYPDKNKSSDENIQIENLADKLQLSYGQNTNVNGGIGFFASFTTITDTVVIRFKREKVNQ